MKTLPREKKIESYIVLGTILFGLCSAAIYCIYPPVFLTALINLLTGLLWVSVPSVVTTEQVSIIALIIVYAGLAGALTTVAALILNVAKMVFDAIDAAAVLFTNSNESDDKSNPSKEPLSNDHGATKHLEPQVIHSYHHIFHDVTKISHDNATQTEESLSHFSATA